MQKLALVMMALLMVSNVLASGYGGYDREPVEVTPVEVTLTGMAMGSCQESEDTIKFSFNGTCEDSYQSSETCPCLDIQGKKYCQFTKTIVCVPHYEVYY